MKFSTRGNDCGFTLIELLVVIAIIGILAGLLIPALVYVQNEANRDAASANMSRLVSALDSYNSEFGDYPPSSLGQFDDVEVNEFNNGAEAMTACLMSKNNGGPFVDWPDDQFGNTDEDKADENITNWFFGDNQLREAVDMWRNPIVYVHHRDYGEVEDLKKYKTSTGKKFEINPPESSSTSTYYNPSTFQVWSIGPDARNSNGSADDVAGW